MPKKKLLVPVHCHHCLGNVNESSIGDDGTDTFRKFQGVYSWVFDDLDFRAVFGDLNFTAGFGCDCTNAFRKFQSAFKWVLTT